jgi:hypothetical protein
VMFRDLRRNNVGPQQLRLEKGSCPDAEEPS